MKRMRRVLSLVLLAIVVGTLLWCAEGRVTAPDRRLTVVRLADTAILASDTSSPPGEEPVRAADTVAPPGEPSSHIRVLAWNIAHGRGDLEIGWRRNWRGGTPEERRARLQRIADVLRRVDADVVVLNEVDFDAGWSHGVNQAAFLARAAGYPSRVEQRSFDVRLPWESYAWGNALLSRIPVDDAAWVDLPAHADFEELIVGSKEAAVVRLRAPGGPVSVVPVHLEFRDEDTRLAAVPVLQSLRAGQPGPLILAGDFNTAPPGWPGVADTTALEALLGLGWRSPRAEGPPSPDELTFPTYALRESRDWVLVEPPLRVVEARVVEGAMELSDHAPVLAVVELPEAVALAPARARARPPRSRTSSSPSTLPRPFPYGVEPVAGRDRVVDGAERGTGVTGRRPPSARR